VGDCQSASHVFDTELVSKVVSELHLGKAPDIVDLTGEHLQFCHRSVLVLLTKLFQLIMLCDCVPSSFKHSYIVPIAKVKDTRTKALTLNDFRGIAIAQLFLKFLHSVLLIVLRNFLKNELILTTAVRKILKIFHIRDYRHNLYRSRGKRNKIIIVDIT